jgi:integrase
MNKLEETISKVLDEIKPQHTAGTFESRKCVLHRLLRFADANGYKEPCQELYDAFTADDKGSPDIWFQLSHTVRIIDRIAGTMAKDKHGRLYNEPPLPTEDEVAAFFCGMVFPVPAGTDINYLIVLSERLLRNYSLSPSTIGQYRHAWIDIRRYFMDHLTITYCKDILLKFIQNTTTLHDDGFIQTWKWKINRKAAYVLIEVAETGSFEWGSLPWHDLSCGEAELDRVRDQYVHSLRLRNLEPATISLHEYVFRTALKHGNISKYSQLTQLRPERIAMIIEGFSSICNNRSVSTILPVLRSILRFLYDEQILSTDFSGMVMPAFVRKNHISAYIPAEDDENLANALEKETARNRAIILLALKLGLRDIDICSLKFSSIDWNQDCLRIPQKKTDEPLCLPLIPEVGNALMDYILKERPMHDDGYPYVFRRKQAPYRKITSAYPVCSRFMERNGIHSVNGKSKGVHVFRYTLVNRLLLAKVPHQVITDTLGHKSRESDKPYLSMEENMLRLCALDLSLTGSIFWEGGSSHEGH